MRALVAVLVLTGCVPVYRTIQGPQIPPSGGAVLVTAERARIDCSDGGEPDLECTYEIGATTTDGDTAIVTGHLSLHAVRDDRALPPSILRHMFLHENHFDRSYGVILDLSAEGRSSDYLATLVVEHPIAWEATAIGLPDMEGAPIAKLSREVNAMTATIAVTTLRSPLETSHDVKIDLSVEGDLVNFGGPVVALGAAGRAGEAARFAAQVGYELALFTNVVVGAHAETDFDSRVAMAVVAELASSWNYDDMLPSVGIGPGVVVQLAPEAAAGVRLQATLTHLLIGISAVADIYPSTGERQLALYGRISL